MKSCRHLVAQRPIHNGKENEWSECDWSFAMKLRTLQVCVVNFSSKGNDRYFHDTKCVFWHGKGGEVEVDRVSLSTHVPALLTSAEDTPTSPDVSMTSIRATLTEERWLFFRLFSFDYSIFCDSNQETPPRFGDERWECLLNSVGKKWAVIRGLTSLPRPRS